MNKILRKSIALLVICVFFVTSLTACSNTEKATDDQEEKKEVKIGYVNWAEGVAMTNLAKVILEDELNYEVSITMADAGPIFTSIANGNYDVFLDGWLPVTHESYMKKFGDDLVDLGYNFEGAKIGLVVPSYVEIDSIEQLNDNKDKFEGKIIGIDSGAGIMKASEKAIEDYDLDFELMSGSGPTMTAALKKAIDNKEWIAVTGWKPHWKFARWDLKFLQDPKKVYGEVENIHTIARKNIKEDLPQVATFFEKFKLNDQELGGLMGMISESDKSEEEVAREWIKENKELVNSWIE